MEVDELAVGGPSADNVRQSKSPMEKMRVRLAAENYNKPNTYQTMPDDSDDERTAETAKGCCSAKISAMPVTVIFFIVALIVIGFIISAVLLAIRLQSLLSVCRSPDCVMIGGEMLSKMDISIDRCQDFYSYACESFISDVTIPPSEPYYTTLSGYITHRRVARMQKLLVEQGSEFKGSNSTAVRKSRQFYAACVNITATEQRGSAPLLKLIKTLGSWPLTSDAQSGVWNDASWDLEVALNTAHHHKSFPFFATVVAVDDKNSSSYVIVLDQSGLSLGSYELYTGNSSAVTRQAFVDFFGTVTRLLGANGTADAYAEDVWQLEKAIAEAFVKPEDRADPQRTYHMMTIDAVQAFFGDLLDVRQLLQLMFGSKFDDSPRINVRVPQYFQKLGVLMRVARRETLATYITWTTVKSMLPFASTPFQQALAQLNMALYGVQGDLPRWERCTDYTDSALGFATGALYVDRYFPESDRHQVESVFDSLMTSFKNRISHVTWMDESTRATALDKAESVVHKIGYPDFVVQPAELDLFYQQFDVTNDSFENALNAANFTMHRNKNKLGNVPDRTEWAMTPGDVNAFYDPGFNQIGIAAGILQRPVYDASFPMSLIFGSIGFVIGHEITHGFDNTGRQFDKYGNLVDWWGNQSAQQFNDLAQCFIDEYSQFVIYGHHENGVSTLGENIADNGGLRISYDALQTWLDDHNYDDALLPGLNMTHSQQFFLSFAQTWCSAYKPQYAIMLLANDVHSNGRDRVNGVVRNMPEFAEAFDCPADAKLNPSKRCTLW